MKTVYKVTLENGKKEITFTSMEEALKHSDDIEVIEIDDTPIELPDPIVPYTVKRKAEYPDIGDQLDVIWKQLNSDRLNGKALDQETDDMLGKILNIKKKYPKED